MGNFSRDTFRLTNLLHQELTGEPVDDGRHYVSVRTQQGVPLLDADLNEAGDIGRVAARLRLMHFFGDGVPSGSDGFRIGPVTADDDFRIAPGMALAGGDLVFNPQDDLTYSEQAERLGVPEPPPLEAPSSGTREDLVYLDVWDEEVPASGAPRADDRLVHPDIGIETATRLERRWIVRVEPDTLELADVPREDGHAYVALALLRRAESTPRIGPDDIVDLRRTDLNVAKHLKVPFSVTRRSVTVDNETLANLLDGLRTALMARLADDLLFIEGAGEPDRTVAVLSLQHVLEVCSTTALQSRTRNLGRADALRVLGAVRDAEAEFVDALETHGVGGSERDAFIAEYRGRLSDLGDAAGADGDLVAGYEAQQRINAWLAAVSDALPEGGVTLLYASVLPFEALQDGQPYTFTVEFTSSVSAPDSTEEVFDVEASLTSDLWTIDRTTDQITLANGGGTGTLEFTVTPNAANPTCTLNVSAEARRNPTIIRTTQPGLALEVGEEPAVGATLLYADARPNDDGRLEVDEALLTSIGRPVQVRLNNATDTEHSYRLEWFITLEAGVATDDWTPLDDAPDQTPVVTVPAGERRAQALEIEYDGSDDVVGVRGTFTVELIEVDATPIPPEDRETLDIPFVVTSG